MRSVSFNYINEAMELLKSSGQILSNRRLRRLAYLDIYQSHYQSYELSNNYKKIVNSDAANNQLIVLLIAVGLITAAILFLLFNNYLNFI